MESFTPRSAISYSSRGVLVAGDDEGENRRSVGIELLDQRRLGIAGQKADDVGDGIAHVLRGHIDVAIQLEGDGHDGQ